MEQQNNFNSSAEEQEITLGDLFFVLRMNWKWFVLSILVCVGIAYLYIKITPNEYSRSATVLIKDNTKGGAPMGETALFQDFGMFNLKSSVDNEMLVFQSKRLMQDVVIRLGLDKSYKVREGLKLVELYTQSPVSIQFLSPDCPDGLSMTITPISEKEARLSDIFGKELVENIEDRTITLRDTVDTPFGPITIIPTLYYGEAYYNKAIDVTKSSVKAVALGYQGKLSISLANKLSTIINLGLTDESIPRAEDVLNTLIAIYNEDAVNDKNQITFNTSKFINERLIIIEKELGSVDSDIETFKRENQLTDIHSETGMYLQESSAYGKEALSLENQITLARFIREYLTDPSKSSDLIPSNTGVSDVNIESQISEYNEVLLRRNKLIGNSSERNPVVMDLNNSLNAMKQTIIRAVDNLIVGLNIQIRNTQERESQTLRRITAVPSQQKYVLSVERQQKIKEELYLYLLNKREENELTQAITESNARIIDPATGSDAPVAPRSMIILLAGLMLGCIIPAAILWLKETLNTSLRNRKELQDGVTMPFLGEIPLKEKKGTEIVVHKNGRDPVSEAFRIVRANMDFMRVKKKDMKVITITSAFPGSGKTFVSINLGMSLALTGKKVVLVDLDIRKATMSKLIHSTSKGVTSYLSEQTDEIRELVQPSKLDENLDMISVGPTPPNPAELLLSERLDLLISWLRENYDYIILDNVPSLQIADAYIINRVVDLTIYLVHANKFPRRMLPDLEQLYKESKFNNMAVLLNGVDYKKGGYGYYSYGYYGYGYGYGHKRAEKREK